MQCLTCGMMNIDPLSHTHTKEGDDSAYSPLPWSDTGMHIRDARGLAIASVLSPLGKFSNEEIDANAALIIESVNQHQALAAGRERLEVVRKQHEGIAKDYNFRTCACDYCAILNEQRSTSE